MKVKELLNHEVVRICHVDEDVEWTGYAPSIPKRYYNDNI